MNSCEKHVCLPTVLPPLCPLSFTLAAFEIRMRLQLLLISTYPCSLLESSPPPLVLHSPSFSCFSSLLILQIFVFLIVSLCVSRLSSVSVSAFRTVHVIFCAVASSVCPTVSSSLSSSLSFLQRMYLSDPCICRSPAPFCLSFDL